MKEVPLTDQVEALAFGEKLLGGRCELLVLLTGVGLRALIDVLETRWPRESVLSALRATTIACRGPKPVAVLKELGMRPAVIAPEPNTTADLVQALAGTEIAGKQVYVQEYGRINEELRVALSARGAVPVSVPVYAWRLPDDIAPLEAAIARLCERTTDAVVFTSAQQLQHVLTVAQRGQRVGELMAALARDVLVASIGPVTSDALRAAEITVDLEPAHPKMGHLVKELVQRGPALLAAKRARS
jgi:uroporphyrinogen-III synthase